MLKLIDIEIKMRKYFPRQNFLRNQDTIKSYSNDLKRRKIKICNNQKEEERRRMIFNKRSK